MDKSAGFWWSEPIVITLGNWRNFGNAFSHSIGRVFLWLEWVTLMKAGCYENFAIGMVSISLALIAQPIGRCLRVILYPFSNRLWYF